MLVVGVVAAVLALPVAGLLAAGKRVPVVLGVLPVVLVPATAAGLGWLGLRAPDLTDVPAPLWVTTTAGSLAQGLEPLVNTGLLAAPAALLVLLGCVVAAFRSAQKQFIPAFAGLLLVLILFAAVVRDFLLYPDAPLPLYAVGVLALGLLACLGLLGGDPEGNAPEAAGIAGVSFVLWVAAAAIGARTALEQELYAALSMASGTMSQKLWASGEGYVLPVEIRGFASVLWASGVGLLGLGAAMGPGGVRRFGNGFGLLWLASGLLALGVVDAAGAWGDTQAKVRSVHRPRFSSAFQLPVVDGGSESVFRTTLQLTEDALSVDGVAVPSDATALRGALQARRAPKLVDLNLAVHRGRTWDSVRSVLQTAREAGFERFHFQAFSEQQGGVAEVEVVLGGSEATDLATVWVEPSPMGWTLHEPGSTIAVPCHGDCEHASGAALTTTLEGRGLARAVVVPSASTTSGRLLVTLDACSRVPSVVVGSILPPMSIPEMPDDSGSAPAVTADAAELTIQGGLTPEQVKSVVDRGQNQLRYCYQRRLTKVPALAGTVVVQVTVASDGTVAGASIASSTLGDPETEQCLTGRFQRMQFPQPAGGGIAMLKIPLTFAP